MKMEVVFKKIDVHNYDYMYFSYSSQWLAAQSGTPCSTFRRSGCTTEKTLTRNPGPRSSTSGYATTKNWQFVSSTGGIANTRLCMQSGMLVIIYGIAANFGISHTFLFCIQVQRC